MLLHLYDLFGIIYKNSVNEYYGLLLISPLHVGDSVGGNLNKEAMMPKFTRVKTRYPGIFYVQGQKDRTYYIRYRNQAGKLIEEKAGSARLNKMTAARANNMREHRRSGNEASNTERRDKAKAINEKWTVQKLFDEYKRKRGPYSSQPTDEGIFRHLVSVADKETSAISEINVEKIRITMLNGKNKKERKYKPQTVKHALTFLARIITFGCDEKLCAPLNFKIKYPKVKNEITEYLTESELANLIKATNNYALTQPSSIGEPARAIVLLAIFTGMRKGAILSLTWNDLDFNHGIIFLRNGKKREDGEVDTIPMNNSARTVLEPLKSKKRHSVYLFPNKAGNARVNYSFIRPWKQIKKLAGLRDSFRFHGLRHAFASFLVSNGEDLGVVSKLLTHRDPSITAKRYAHFQKGALVRASGRMDEITERIHNIKTIASV